MFNFLQLWLITRLLVSVAYYVGHYEKHREDNKIPPDEESLLLAEEERIEWNPEPPAQVGFQDFALWFGDEVRQLFYNVLRMTLMPATDMGSLGCGLSGCFVLYMSPT